jgi:hypothetical protein
MACISGSAFIHQENVAPGVIGNIPANKLDISRKQLYYL